MVKASDIMLKNAVTMEVDKGFEGVLDIILNTKADYVLITQNKKPIGIITERDVIKRILDSIKKKPKIKLEDAMSKDLITVNKDTEIRDLSELMQSDDIRHLPVMEHGRLSGIVTSADIVRATSDIQGKNRRFTTYQNIQTAIIVAFFIFFIGYLLIKAFM